MAAKFVAEEGVLKGTVLSLEQGEEWTIGRDPDECQLLIEDPSASRKHLVCRKTDEGIILENLSETNPALINGEEATEPHLLKHGDSIQIGNGIYRFYAEDQAQVFDEEPEEEEEKTPEAPEEAEKEEKPEEPSPEPTPEPAPEPETAEETPPEPEEGKKPEDLGTYPEETETPPEEPETAPEPSFPETAEKSEEPEAEPTPEPTPEPEKPKTTEKPEEPEAKLPPAEEEELRPDEEEEHPSIFEEDLSKEDTLAHISFDMIEAGRWLIKVVGGPNNGAEFSMQTGTTYLIGTDPTACDIVFHDTSVSRKHARIVIDAEDHLTIEDLNSRNGTLLNGKQFTGISPLEANNLVTMGTTSFVLYDREGKMQTIISPLLPSIVKSLQKEEEEKKAEEEAAAAAEAAVRAAAEAAPEQPAPEPQSQVGAFILIGVITGLFIVVGIGTVALFREAPQPRIERADPTVELQEIFAAYPEVRYSFNSRTSHLLLVGHVLQGSNQNQLMYYLRALPFVKSIDDSGIVIDEFVWTEFNQVLAHDPRWKGINIRASAPGKFVVSGYLETRREAEALSDYLNANFPYLDLLEKRVVIEESVVNSTGLQLQRKGIKEVTVQMADGIITLKGGIPADKQEALDTLINEFEEISGVRGVKNFVTIQAAEELMINVSERYEITGSSHHRGIWSIVVEGRILTEGDVLDGMTITKITRNTIFLQRGNIEYRIDY